ncbi:Coiled-coil domain-containing protein 137 [Camelus dromedarius]|uniref:Coiled-coil domain-containing protein 137 n=2 Tax=Camelus dromedarius TaxID=9838 RepID=A0A5N4D5U5_CAMDR|nr:coiled-coil domain-containing protein 137 isoform X1 [Camelus dromedarius]KAB1266440.1 Coiled-coil domain-containing protein 137 [Camelus dromedarius]
MEMARARREAAAPAGTAGHGTRGRRQGRLQQQLGKRRSAPRPGPRSEEKKKVDCKPKNQDEQEIPFRLREIMRIRQEMKNPISNKKRKKEAQVAFRKTLEKEAKGEEPDIAVPKFTQRKWESDGAYVRRMEQEAQHVLFLSKNQASRQPEARAAPRKEKSERKKAFQKRRLEKARQRREEKAAERLEQELLQDMVKFGEVVLQPPELTAKPRMSMSRGQLCLHLPGSASQPGGRVLMLEKSLSPGTASQPQSTSPARQRIVVQERERAVQAYRALKRLQRQQQGPQPSGSPWPASRKTPEARLRW